MSQQGIDQCVIGIAGRGMDDQAGRLVQHQEVGVLVQDVERQRLRHGFGGLRRRNIDDETVAAFDLAGGLFYCRSVSQRHPPAFDQRLHPASREGRQGGRQRTVQPLAGHAVVEGHGVAAGIGHGVVLASPSPARPSFLHLTPKRQGNGKAKARPVPNGRSVQTFWIWSQRSKVRLLLPRLTGG